MNKYTLRIVLALLISSGAFAQVETDYSSYRNSVDSEGITLERRLNHYLKVQNNLFLLPLEKLVIINNIIPAVDSIRHILAPNFPETIFIDHLTMSQETKESHLLNWMCNYPEERKKYVDYLDNLVRGYKN